MTLPTFLELFQNFNHNFWEIKKMSKNFRLLIDFLLICDFLKVVKLKNFLAFIFSRLHFKTLMPEIVNC